MAAYDRRDLSKGAAVQTTLNGGISSGATSAVLAATTGWPDGSPGAFYVVVDPGLTTEEKILCSTRSSTTLNFTTRGADGTSAAAHASGAVIYPCLAAVDLDEANLAVAKTLKLATAAGQILVVDAANSFAAVQAKTSGQILVGNGTTLASVAVSGDATLASTGVLTVAPAANVAMSTHKLTGLAAGTTNGDSVRYEQVSGLVSAATLGTLSGGYVAVTTNQAGISTLADLTSLTVTVTVTAGRRIKITGYGSFLQAGGGSGLNEFFIVESSTTLGEAQFLLSAGVRGTLVAQAVLTPSTGSHTYKLQASTSGSTTQLLASSTAPAWLLVEDIGV